MDHRVDFGLTVRRATTNKIVVVQLLWEIEKNLQSQVRLGCDAGKIRLVAVVGASLLLTGKSWR